MNGIHDLGGMTCFGPIDPEPDEPVFHADWERRVFAMNLAALAFLGPVDRARHAIERMDPVEYLSTSYYEHWLVGLVTLAKDLGYVTQAEVERVAPPRSSRHRFRRRTRWRSRASCVTACPQPVMTAESHLLSVSATRCERATSKSRVTRGCRATCGARWVSSPRSVARTSSRTRPRTIAARTPNPCTRCDSRRRSSGATTWLGATASTSIFGKTTWRAQRGDEHERA